MESRKETLKPLLEELEAVAQRAAEAGFPELGTALRVAGAATLLGLEAELIDVLGPLVLHATKTAWLELGLGSFGRDGEEPS